MRLLKLAMLGLFGYALYEFFRGMMQDVGMSGGASSGGGRTRDEHGRFISRAGNGGMNITGPGRGTDESTLDPNGGSVRHKVGRGVVS
jgi:hypothetical protein